MKVTVVVPTYQERGNIGRLIKGIGGALKGRDYEIVVVDDNSPDGTAEVAAGLAQTYPVKVIRREGKLGLGSAILAGFSNAQGDIVGVIDADLQHPPELIAELVTAVENGVDIAIASRYVSGGGVEHWSASRKAVSKAATLLARPLTRTRDPMSGYFFVRRGVIDTQPFAAVGYKLLLEILVKGSYETVRELPYTFRERQEGHSKLGVREYVRYLKLLGHLYFGKAKGILGSKGS